MFFCHVLCEFDFLFFVTKEVRRSNVSLSHLHVCHCQVEKPLLVVIVFTCISVFSLAQEKMMMDVDLILYDTGRTGLR